MEPEVRFGRNVAYHRREQELSQEALAALADFHPTEISRLERGVREPRLSTIVRVARALKVKPSDLLDGIR